MEAARLLGFEFVSRGQSSLVLNILGEEVTYDVLNILEYSSDRWVSYQLPASHFSE